MRKVFIFIFIFGPLFVNASVVINEIAWMGTANSASDEWVELYSESGASLDGWTLSAADGGMTISLSGSVFAGGYYLIERTDDNTVPGIAADLVTPFGNGLNNATGEVLILKDGAGNEINRVDASGGWPAGNNSTKETMQRVGSSWVTSPATPRAPNSETLPPSPSPPPAPPPAPDPEPEPEPPPSRAEPMPTPQPPFSPAPAPDPGSVPSEPEPASISSPPSESGSLLPPTLSPIPIPPLAEEPASRIQAETAPDRSAVVETKKEEKPQPPAKSPTQLAGDNLEGENSETATQAALLPESLPEDQQSIFSSGWFWLGAAALLGLVSAGGVFVIRRLIW